MQWDVFCRAIDNFGDVGVAWRLCADLAERGQHIRLWVDDPSALVWMAPQLHPRIQVTPWTQPAPDLPPGDVVIETFGCNPPERFVQRMAERTPVPTWINLEHLSAEPFVERSHGLPSPATVAPGSVLSKHFYFPGFTPCSGGLLREPGRLEEQLSFDRMSWLRELKIFPAANERIVSLFCYTQPGLPALLESHSTSPTLLLVTPGAPAQQVSALLGPTLRCGALRARLLPYLSQPDYDRLLWACDLNFVRGEDSFVRAQWAGKPFVWQIYPQHDGAHIAKLDAFLSLLLAGADSALAAPLHCLWWGWNGLGPPAASLPAMPMWQQWCERWCASLVQQTDLVTQLLASVSVGGNRTAS
ncbi:MAG: elongation factor P maturation arginine rhamnosyltransferase EarP [Burkholderiaceae bacterium]|nr:elongation factor P maturation arginine rhamnosyltransferase EarP [Burkholderiaceae bacterium]